MSLSAGIPSEEPIIDVGIVLPEDRQKRLRIEIPHEGDYALQVDGNVAIGLQGGSMIEIQRNSNALEILLAQNKSQQAQRIEIGLQGELAPNKGYGLLVRDVVAGRNFHWQKNIDVTLPGGLLCEMYQDVLMLINRLPFEQYVMCVATSEMSAECPDAFLEAQTITARSWMLANVEQKHRALGMDVCNDDCCQRYQGSTFLSKQAVAATSATSGKVLLHGDLICDARYSKSCGGMMEAFEAVWPGKPHPYLQIKPDLPETELQHVPDLTSESAFQDWLNVPPKAYCSPHYIAENELKTYLGSVDESGRYYRWSFSLLQKEITELLNEKLNLYAEHIEALHVRKRGGSGRVMQLAIVYVDRAQQQRTHLLDSEYAIRAALHPHFLYSSAIVIEPKYKGGHVPDSFKIDGCGWGHGVGLCQIGGLGMALAGESAENILSHYYPGSNLQKIY